MEHFILNDGNAIPSIGFGTWQIPDGKETLDAVKVALEVGYRHIDTAAAYDNEVSVGEAIRQSGIPRDQLFITTKLWNGNRGYDSTLRAFDESMKKLNLSYLDLYLIHWPAKGTEGVSVNRETWRAMEKLHREGRIRSIGVSNFLIHHLKELMEGAEIMPAVNQIEHHPGYVQAQTVRFCQSNQIQVEAWSPLGSGRVLEDEGLKEIAARYNKSVAQLCIRWCLQSEIIPIPKSVTPERIGQNQEVFDFTIVEDDMERINQMPETGFSGLNPDQVTF